LRKNGAKLWKAQADQLPRKLGATRIECCAGDLYAHRPLSDVRYYEMIVRCIDQRRQLLIAGRLCLYVQQVLQTGTALDAHDDEDLPTNQVVLSASTRGQAISCPLCPRVFLANCMLTTNKIEFKRFLHGWRLWIWVQHHRFFASLWVDDSTSNQSHIIYRKQVLIPYEFISCLHTGRLLMERNIINAI
jgi:hypothetical protein